MFRSPDFIDTALKVKTVILVYGLRTLRSAFHQAETEES